MGSGPMSLKQYEFVECGLETQPPSPPPSPATVVTQSLSTVTSLPPSQSSSSLSHDHLHTDLPSSLFPLVFPSLANAKLVYACEWNPNAIEALQHNLQANSVIDCCIVLEEDNRITHLKVLLIVFVLVSFQQVRVAGSPL
ncbi:hypothetical protein ACJW31_11G030900 [Castanea mollissima]